ncbi:transcriptional regulator [Streptomyces sp. NPDC058595]|uniref:transcriptional regulator n=1 Tax=Streptomyces sp. NPDC058595 TaxID=3346550 RepID=UPI00365EFE27
MISPEPVDKAEAVTAVLPLRRPTGSQSTSTGINEGSVVVLPELFVPEACQWLSTTAGRVATDGYSWMQAVHWVVSSGLYRPRRHRSHGPRSFGPTTVRVAQELAALFPCRPGIEYLVRRTGLSERSVEYHLGMLRETGLLAYVVRGTRVRGQSAMASEFARMIPVEFDAALGIRTKQRDPGAPAYTRVMTGIAATGRELMARLAKKAARKVRKPRSKPGASKAPTGVSRAGADGASEAAVSEGSRCTPMQGGTRSSSPTGTPTPPSESKLASGKKHSPTPKQRKPKALRKLNRVGRRYQLARELITLVPWMSRASVRRIAWVIRHVADAGWSADEVRAVIDQIAVSDTVHRPSGYLARRLTGAHELWNTPARRRQLVEDWRDTTARHTEWAGEPEPQTSPRLVAQFMAGLDQGKAAYAARQAALGHDNLNTPQAGAADAEADFAAFFASADALTGAFC